MLLHSCLTEDPDPETKEENYGYRKERKIYHFYNVKVKRQVTENSW